MKKYILEITVFFCGAIVMILELVGSRILAPYLGTSIIVWTSLIGIILGALSIGYWWGGKLSDQKPSYKRLAFIIFIAGLSTGFIVLIKAPVLNFIQDNISNINFGVITAAIFLFALPSILLGMVSPYAAKLKIKDVQTAGSTVGRLYALSTIGSIAGTFSAGFLLIPLLGSIKIIFFLSIALILISILVYARDFLKVKIGGVIIFLILFLITLMSEPTLAGRGFTEIDTRYNHVTIFKSAYRGKPVKGMLFDPFSTQSAIYLDDDELVFDYTRFYRIARHFNSNIKKGLMIGGAAYTYPRDFLKKYPQAELDVIEIDSQLTEIAKKYFKLEDNPRLRIYHEDARIFLNKNKKNYDVIFGDAFTSHLSIPYHLTTIETAQKIYQALDDNGLVLINLISAIEGEKGKFLRAEYLTYKNIFPQVYVFLVEDQESGQEAQNLILIALKSEQEPAWTNNDEELNKFLGHLWTKEIAESEPILTDDYAPVDYYAMKMR